MVLSTLCSDNKFGREDWMRAIRMFHNCDIELVPYEDEDRQRMMVVKR